MGNIGFRLRADGRTRSWYYRLDLPPGPDGKRRQRWQSGFRTERDAKAARAAALREIERGGSLDASRITYAEYLDRWLEEVVRPHRSAGTYHTYQVMARTRIKPALGGTVLAQLKPPEIRRFIQDLVDTGAVKASSARLVLAIIKRSLGQAVRDELLERNPASLVEAPSCRETEVVEAPTPAAFRALLHAAQETWLGPIVLVGIDTGLRRGELLGLRWQDLDLDRGVVQVCQQVTDHGAGVRIGALKTRSSRRALVLTSVVVEALRAHRQEQDRIREIAGPAWQEFDLVFTEGDGTPIRPAYVTNGFRRLCAKIGITAHLHQLRHLSATLLRQGGIDTRTIAARLGHSSPTLTAQVYEHVTPLDQERASDVMDLALRTAIKGDCTRPAHGLHTAE